MRAYSRLFQQRLTWGKDRHFVEFGCDTATVGVSLGSSEAFAKLQNLLFASAAPANLGPAAGCGHAVLLIVNFVT